MKSIKFKEPKIIYEVVGKNSDGDWETIKSNIKTLYEARIIAKSKIRSDYYTTIDINLIIDDDLVETYDTDGKIR